MAVRLSSVTSERNLEAPLSGLEPVGTTPDGLQVLRDPRFAADASWSLLEESYDKTGYFTLHTGNFQHVPDPAKDKVYDKPLGPTGKTRIRELGGGMCLEEAELKYRSYREAYIKIMEEVVTYVASREAVEAILHRLSEENEPRDLEQTPKQPPVPEHLATRAGAATVATITAVLRQLLDDAGIAEHARSWIQVGRFYQPPVNVPVGDQFTWLGVKIYPCPNPGAGKPRVVPLLDQDDVPEILKRDAGELELVGGGTGGEEDVKDTEQNSYVDPQAGAILEVLEAVGLTGMGVAINNHLRLVRDTSRDAEVPVETETGVMQESTERDGTGFWEELRTTLSARTEGYRVEAQYDLGTFVDAAKRELGEVAHSGWIPVGFVNIVAEWLPDSYTEAWHEIAPPLASTDEAPNPTVTSSDQRGDDVDEDEDDWIGRGGRSGPERRPRLRPDNRRKAALLAEYESQYLDAESMDWAPEEAKIRLELARATLGRERSYGDREVVVKDLDSQDYRWKERHPFVAEELDRLRESTRCSACDDIQHELDDQRAKAILIQRELERRASIDRGESPTSTLDQAALGTDDYLRRRLATCKIAIGFLPKLLEECHQRVCVDPTPVPAPRGSFLMPLLFGLVTLVVVVAGVVVAVLVLGGSENGADTATTTGAESNENQSGGDTGSSALDDQPAEDQGRGGDTGSSALDDQPAEDQGQGGDTEQDEGAEVAGADEQEGEENGGGDNNEVTVDSGDDEVASPVPSGIPMLDQIITSWLSDDFADEQNGSTLGETITAWLNTPDAKISRHNGAETNMTTDVEKQAGANTSFPCGGVADAYRVTCPKGAGLFDAGEYVVVAMQLEAPVASGEGSHTYGLAFGSPNEAENYQFTPPFDGDLFRNTKYWYRLHIDADGNRFMWADGFLDGVPGVPRASSALVIEWDDWVIFVIPRDEIPLDELLYRLTAFNDLGDPQQTPSPDSSGGDVSGLSVLEPLTSIEGPAIVFDNVEALPPDIETVVPRVEFTDPPEDHITKVSVQNFLDRMNAALASGDREQVIAMVLPQLLGGPNGDACRTDMQGSIALADSLTLTEIPDGPDVSQGFPFYAVGATIDYPTGSVPYGAFLAPNNVDGRLYLLLPSCL
jgi:hypothetical protein